ncbi:hypothetical protein KEJ25_08780 [Candidatus Bathyarchaeota archaeon]|nr:hypothetical protein [Candidatus Bathyarchaeota archaeon]
MRPLYNSAERIASAVENGEISAIELLDEIFERIKAVEPKINAFITLAEDKAY